ncbi:magnesium transporter [Flexibacter flexilis DSM 6793]|uniref:Magnesium transporter MgtE n=1 Tax=Flexibacter flexilis DSM 6793 TaxID=927664 RepID=A0A1I1EAG4_9BACT|nr:magnesium transporter [Flexibacter flexilis]SFB84114.1 magnesium transporter [Flexibacter flexilis DSM 6793]
MQLELSKEYLERLETAIEKRDEAFIRESMDGEHPADISSVLYELDTAQSKYVIDLLPREVSAEIISSLDGDTQRKFLKAFTSAELAELIPYVDSDDAADLLNQQPVKFREEVIALINDAETANHIIELLHYDEDCAGGLMAKELIKANINWTVVQCIEEIRRQAEDVEKIFSVYVVDDEDKLLGRVSLKKIILARAYTRIADIYEDDIIAVESYRDSEEVAEMMQKYDLETIPVVNIQGKLLGRITIDDVVDVITEQAELDQQMMSGLSQPEEEDDGVLTSAKARLPWLLIGMGGGLLGARFAGFFEADIKLIPAMAFFIPLITATGGNVGIQSSTVVVQSLTNASFLGNSFYNRIVKVLLVALINAAVISTLVFLFNILTGSALQLALVVSIALFSVVILASLMGTITPIILNRFEINPALASGPFITTANDLLGLAVYFGVAHWLYNL